MKKNSGSQAFGCSICVSLKNTIHYYIVNKTFSIMGTEKEKARAGLLYDANYDEELLAERMACAEKLHKLNLMSPSRETERRDLLRGLLGRTPERFTILSPFYCDYGYNIEVGEDFFMNVNCVVLDGARVTFGNHVFVAPGCGFFTAGHPLDVEQRNRGLEIALPITVGDNVWIGGNVSVLPGVSIGQGSVIGAGSVVTHDIPAGVVAAGNPCRVIRKLTAADREKYARSR